MAASVSSADVRIGSGPPHFSVTSMGGKQVFFQDMQTGGPIFVYFVRDGDAISQQATSYINQIIRSYGKSRTTWYGIINARNDHARSFQAETSPAFRLETDENLAATRAFGVVNAPAVFEFDGNGILINVWKGFSAVNLKGLNMANAEGNHKPVHAIDFSKAPATAVFGVDFNAGTPARAGSG